MLSLASHQIESGRSEVRPVWEESVASLEGEFGWSKIFKTGRKACQYKVMPVRDESLSGVKSGQSGKRVWPV